MNLDDIKEQIIDTIDEEKSFVFGCEDFSFVTGNVARVFECFCKLLDNILNAKNKNKELACIVKSFLKEYVATNFDMEKALVKDVPSFDKLDHILDELNKVLDKLNTK